MGLSVAISGGIILTIFVLMLFSLPGLAEKMFSIGDIASQVTKHEQKISNTEINMNYLSQSVGSSKVNFTLSNDGSEKLWNFEDFDLFIEYDGAISGKIAQRLSYSGECLGTVPQAGNWCIQSISSDVADPQILNSGEQANIRTNLNENLASETVIVTVVTDNGVTFKTGNPSCGNGIPLPSCKKFGMIMPADDSQLGIGLFEGLTVDGTDTFGSDSDGSRMTMTSGAAAGNNAGVRTTGTMTNSCHLEWNCYLDAKVQLGSTAGSLMFVGFRSASGALANNDTPCSAQSCAGFLIRSTDNVFQIVTNDGGGAQVLQATGVNEDLAAHRFEVRADAVNNRFGFKIDDGTEIFVSSQIPAPQTNLARYVSIVNRDAVADSFEFYYVYMENDK
jgi:hypothetical protein